MKLEYKLNEEALQALFRGKNVVFSYDGRPDITLYPPNYGVFMTHEKYQELVRAAEIKVAGSVLEILKNAKNEAYIKGK